MDPDLLGPLVAWPLMLLTAWSAAGIAGPLIVNAIAEVYVSREYERRSPDSEKTISLFSAQLQELKAKVDAGATRAITQFFFDTDVFLRFMDKVRKAGVTIPISPGIMPVSNFKGLKKMAGPVGITIPDWLANLFEGLDNDAETRRLIACSVASVAASARAVARSSR